MRGRERERYVFRKVKIARILRLRCASMSQLERNARLVLGMVRERECARHDWTSVSIVNWRGNAGNWPRRFETVSTICPSTRPTDRPPTGRKGCRNERRGSVDDAPVLALVSSRLVSSRLSFPPISNFVPRWLVKPSLNRARQRF